jgi:HSP20 family protein
MSKRISSPFGTIIIDQDDMSGLIKSINNDGEQKARRHESVAMTPNVDIYEDSRSLRLWMDLPGVDKDSIQVTVSGNEVAVNARTQKLNLEGGHWVRHERPVGNFVRNLRFGAAIDESGIVADYSDGTLVLTIAKPEQSESRNIEVNM